MLFNLKDYTVLQHIFFATGCLFWVFTYFIVIRGIRKNKFVEIPLIAVTANFAWELLWSFFFITDMGEVYVWGYRIWFFLDCFILVGLFRYGYKQILNNMMQTRALMIILFSLSSWILMLYMYIKNYDYPISHNGVYSGYILNVMMSAMYIPLLLNTKDLAHTSTWAAWWKGVGTLFISVFCFLRYSDGFLLSMCVVTALLDAIYIYLIMTKNRWHE